MECLKKSSIRFYRKKFAQPLSTKSSTLYESLIGESYVKFNIQGFLLDELKEEEKKIQDPMNIAPIKIFRLKRMYNNQAGITDISMMINPSDVVGILGPNGAGKSTIFKILTKNLSKDQGTFVINDKVGHFL